MGEYPKLTMAGGYLASTPFLRGSSLDEWAKDPVGRLKNAGGEFAGELAGSAALHLATGQKWKNFDLPGETIGAAIESVIQNEETRLGNAIARGIGLGGSSLPQTITPGRSGMPAPTAQRSLVAEAQSAAAPQPVATPGVATPTVSVPPAPTVTIPPAPAATGTTIPTAPVAQTPNTPIQPGTPTAAIPTVTPTANARTPAATTELPVAEEDFKPVQPRPANPNMAATWDEMYADTHNPDGRPKTYVDRRPSISVDIKNDPDFKPEYQTLDRGTGNPEVPRRPRVIPSNIATNALPDLLDSNSVEKVTREVEEAASKDPKIAEYVKNNKASVDQAIQAAVEWSKKYSKTNYTNGQVRPGEAENAIISKYNPYTNPEYKADLERRQKEWDAKHGEGSPMPAHAHSGEPKDNKRASRILRESIDLKKAGFKQGEQGVGDKKISVWQNDKGDSIEPKDIKGRRAYAVYLHGKNGTMNGQGVNQTNAAAIVQTIQEATEIIDAHNKPKTPAPTATQPQAAPAQESSASQSESKDTTDTKDKPPVTATSKPEPATQQQESQAATPQQIAEAAKFFEKVPEYKWASPTGDAYANFRMGVMKALGAQGVTRSNSGVNAYREFLIQKFGIDKNQTIAKIDSDIIAFLKKLLKGSSGSTDNDESVRGDIKPETTATKDKKPAGQKPGPASVTKPVTEDEKAKLKELNLEQIRQDNEDAEDEDADVNEPFHSIFTDIAERNGYMNKAEMKAYLEGVFGAKEFADMDASKALAKWTPAPKPIKWDGKKTPISGTDHSVATVPNSTPRQKGGYGGRERSAVVIFDKDGKAVLIGRVNEWRNRYSGASMIGPDLFDGGVASRESFNGMVPKYESFEDMVADIGKQEAIKVYDEFIKAQIAEMRKLAKDLKFNPKEDGSAVRVRFERFNRSPFNIESGKGLSMDPLNEILGLTGEESDIDFATAVEKRYGITFADAGRGYGSGWNVDEKFRRHYEFSFDINVPGLPKQKRGEHWMFNLNNHDWIQAVKYEALASRIKDPSKEASDLRKKIPDLAWEGAARKKAEAKLEALNEAYAKKVLEDMKVYSPEDSRYVKGSVIPDYFPGQTDMTFNEGEIERLATIYKPDPIETIPDTNSSEKPPENAKKNLAFIEKNDRELYTLLQEHSMLAKKIKAISESLQKGESDDIDADISKHAELTRKLLKAKLDIIIQTNKLEKKYEAEREKVVEQQSRVEKKFPVGKDSYISFDTASTKEANNIELDESADERIKDIDKEILALRDEKNNLDDDDPADKSKIKELEAKIGDAELRKNAISSVKKKTVNATITSADGTSKGSVKINIGEPLPDYAREEDSYEEEGESSTHIKIDVDWKSVSQDELNDIVENAVIRMLSMRTKTETRRHDNLTEVVLFPIDGLDENSVKMLKKAVGEIQSKDTRFEKSTYSKAIKDGKAILFSLTDATVGSMSEDGMTSESIEYGRLEKEDGGWTREAIRNLVVDAESSLPMFDKSKVNIVEELIDDTDEQLDIEKLKIKQLVDDAIKGIGPESYKGLKEMVQAMKDFKSGKMFGDKGVQQEAKPTKPAKTVQQAAQPAAQATPASDNKVIAMSQEKPNDSASLKTARTKLRAVIEKIGADSQQAMAMAKNIERAEQKQASYNQSAEGVVKPYSASPEPDAVTQARSKMAEGLKKGQTKSVAYRKAQDVVFQYEAEHDLFTGTVTDEGIKRVSNRVLEEFLQQAQDAINQAGGMSKAGEVLKGELGLAFNMAQDEYQRRMREEDRKDEYGDLLADVGSVVRASGGSIAVPTLPKALQSSYSEMSEMFDAGFTTGKNSILRQPMHGIDVPRYKTDKDYKKQVNDTAEAMLEKLAMRLSEMGWAQFDPSNFSSNELMDALYEAGMGKALVPRDGVIGAKWKGEVGNVASLANTDTTKLPQDLFKATEKPKQLGAKPSGDLIDEADTFSLSGEKAAPAPTQTTKDTQTQDLAPETEEPAYIAQARTQLAKLEKSGKNPEQQRTLRDTIEQYEATKKQPEPQQEQATEAQPTTGVATQEQTEEYESLKSQADDTISDLESTAGGQAKADKAVNGKKGLIAMVRDAIEKFKLGENPQDTADMLRAASTVANELADSNEEAANNIEDMGREDQFSDRGDMIDQLRELAETLDQMADISEAVAGNQAETSNAPAARRTIKDIQREIGELRDAQRKDQDELLARNLPYRDTDEGLTAIRKKYEPQFKKLNAELKKASKNDPGAMSVEGAIAKDSDVANAVLGLKRKLDSGVITQAEYDEAHAKLMKDGFVRAVRDEDGAKNQPVVSNDDTKTKIKGSEISGPLPESITNQASQDEVIKAVISEMVNQVNNSQSAFRGNGNITISDVKGGEQFIAQTIKEVLSKNPEASYLEITAAVFKATIPLSTKFKGKTEAQQNLHMIAMSAYRVAVGNLRVSQLARGISESETVSGDIGGLRYVDTFGHSIMKNIGMWPTIQKFMNDSPDGNGDMNSKGGRAYALMKAIGKALDDAIATGKYVTTTELFDAAIKSIDDKTLGEFKEQIYAYLNSRKSADPFSRYDRLADDNDKARELDTRVDRNSKNRAGDPDTRKGFTGMISRALDELRLRGEITAKEAEGLTRIMNYIGSQFFSGEKMSIKNDNERGYYGMYSWGDKVLTIFRDAMRDGRFEYTAAHEIAHLLTKYLPDKDRRDLINEWRSARMKFLKENPGIAAVLSDPYADFNAIKFTSLQVQKAESIQPGASKMFVQKLIPVGLSGKTKTVYVMAAHEGVYQIFNSDEFFAENFAKIVMKRLNSDPAYTGNPNTWREKLASLWDMIKTGFRQMFGKDVTARILADFAKGKISPDMKGNYGLHDLHNAMPSKGATEKVDLMSRDQRMGDDKLVVTEQSERELAQNLARAANKSMTIKDAVHMVLRGVSGPKADLIRLLTARIDRNYRVQFSDKKYSELYKDGLETSEGNPIPSDKVLGLHSGSGQYIRIFLPMMTAKEAKLRGQASLADIVSYVLTHEVIHSYTKKVIDGDAKLRSHAQALINEIREELSLTMSDMHIDEKFYGLTSPAELLTECLIDPKLREIANSIQSKTKRLSELRGQTVLEKIVSLFQSALESVGIKVNRDSVLDRVSEIIAVERDATYDGSKGQQHHLIYVMRGSVMREANYTQTEDYSYSPDSPTAVRIRSDITRGKKAFGERNARELERAKKYREQGMEDLADTVEMDAKDAQDRFDTWVRGEENKIKGVMPMLEQAIPDLKKIDGNDTPSARETLLGIRDDVMPSIGPANREPVRKTEEKTIGQIAWDVVSGRYFSGLSTKAHQNADRHDYSETVKQVANMIHSRPGVDSNSTERDIPTAMMTSRIKFQNRFQEIVTPLRDMLSGFKDTEAGTAREQREVVYRALHDMIRGDKPITKGKLGEVATKLKSLFKELRDYRIEAGEKLGDVEDYFPAVYDSPRIAQERGAFTRDASEAYKITIQDLAKPDIHLNKLARMDSKKLAKALGVSQDEVEAGVTEKGVSIDDLMQQKAVDQANSALAKELGITKQEVEDGASESGVSIDQLILERAAARANELFQTHLRGMGSEEFDSIFGGQSGSGKENTNLSRVFGPEAQKVMSKWQVADPFRVVTSYITSSVKKAEVVRKFGAEGEIWKQYAEQMEADGVPYEVISEMRELVRVASGYGVAQKNKAAQTYVDSITMMTAASAMGRGFLNNLVEPVTMGIRAGNPIAAARGLIETWGRFIREVASLSPAIKAKLGETFWSEYGKEIGTIHSSIEDAWMATHSMDLDADRADPRFRWITNRIYQANLMDASEVAKQQASHAVGYSFILGLAKLKQGKSWMNNLGMDTTQSTTDQLNELGIPEDQHAEFAKFVMSLERMNDIDRMKAMTENSDMAKLHQEAMVRFSYQSSVRSNRAHKPVFQDDLFGKTVLQLMNFSYSFAAEVNSRLFSMTKQAFTASPEGKNYSIGDRVRMAAPVMSGFLAIVAYKMLFDLKDELYPTEGTEKRKKDPAFLKWVNATSYAGFLGPKAEQLIKIIKRDQAPGGPVGQSLVNVARAATTGAEALAQGKDMGTAKRQAAKAAIPIIKGGLNAGASAVNPIFGAITTQATNTTGWANELVDENKPSKGIGDALFAKPIQPKKIEK